MSRSDERILALLVSISDEIAALRRDVKALQTGLIRIGAIIPKKAEAAKLAATWEPPALKRLGDLITIIAQSNPASAAALKQSGFDTERDPEPDPLKDAAGDQDLPNAQDVTDSTDPRNIDNDMTPKDNFTRNFDPKKIDKGRTMRDRQDVQDPQPPDPTDDKDQFRTDTTADSLT